MLASWPESSSTVVTVPFSSQDLSAWLRASDADTMSPTRWLKGGHADGLPTDLLVEVLQVRCCPQMHVKIVCLVCPIRTRVPLIGGHAKSASVSACALTLPHALLLTASLQVLVALALRAQPARDEVSPTCARIATTCFFVLQYSVTMQLTDCLGGHVSCWAVAICLVLRPEPAQQRHNPERDQACDPSTGAIGSAKRSRHAGAGDRAEALLAERPGMAHKRLLHHPGLLGGTAKQHQSLPFLLQRVPAQLHQGQCCAFLEAWGGAVRIRLPSGPQKRCPASEASKRHVRCVF
jgi:hypothetical protein